MSSDRELLRRYALQGCGESFALLVRRHVAWVHAASVRQVRDPGTAEDVTQAVFILLARRAATLPDAVHLTGWLFNTVRYAAAEARRKDARRRKHEARAAMPADTISPHQGDDGGVNAAWAHLAPELDETLAVLRESDRQALLLRYFENKDFAEIAQLLGINEAAARKRVSRAVAKLREALVNRGVIAPAGAGILLLLLSRAADAAVPAHLTDAIASVATAHAGTLPPLSLALARRTGAQMLRARRRLAKAVACGAALAFLGLWGLLISAMLDNSRESRPIPAGTGPLDPAQGFAPLRANLIDDQDERTLRQRRAPRPGVRGHFEFTGVATPPAVIVPGATFDPLWHLRPYLDPLATPAPEPNALTRRAPNDPAPAAGTRTRPRGADPDDRFDPEDPYGSYSHMGGGGGPIVEARPGSAAAQTYTASGAAGRSVASDAVALATHSSTAGGGGGGALDADPAHASVAVEGSITFADPVYELRPAFSILSTRRPGVYLNDSFSAGFHPAPGALYSVHRGTGGSIVITLGGASTVIDTATDVDISFVDNWPPATAQRYTNMWVVHGQYPLVGPFVSPARDDGFNSAALAPEPSIMSIISIVVITASARRRRRRGADHTPL